MEKNILSIIEIMGKIAGIGGLSLAVFFILSYSILRLPVFSKMTKIQSYKSLKTIIISSLILAILGLFLNKLHIIFPNLEVTHEKFRSLLMVSDPQQAVTLIEEIANSSDKKKIDYLRTFSAEKKGLSQIEVDAVQKAISATSENKKIYNLWNNLYDSHLEKTKELPSPFRFVFLDAYIHRTDSKLFEKAFETLNNMVFDDDFMEHERDKFLGQLESKEKKLKEDEMAPNQFLKKFLNFNEMDDSQTKAFVDQNIKTAFSVHNTFLLAKKDLKDKAPKSVEQSHILLLMYIFDGYPPSTVKNLSNLSADKLYFIYQLHHLMLSKNTDKIRKHIKAYIHIAWSVREDLNRILRETKGDDKISETLLEIIDKYISDFQKQVFSE